MKKNNYTIAASLAFFIFLIGCHSSKRQDGSLIEIDLTKTYSEHEYVLQEVAEVIYLPLETQDDFLVHGHVEHIDLERIIIKSNNRDQLFFFERNTGTLTGKLSQKGNSGKEYNYIAALVFDKNTNEIFIFDSNRKRILIYDLSQRYIRSFETMNCQQMVDFNNQSLLVCSEQRDSISSPFFLISKDNGEIIQTLDIVSGPRLHGFPVHVPGGFVTTSFLSGVSGSLITANNNVLISEWSCDTMYRFDYLGTLEPVAVRIPPADKMEPRWLLHLRGENSRFVMFTATYIKGFTSGMVVDIEYKHIIYDKLESKLATPRFINTDDPTGAVWSGKTLNQFESDMVTDLSADKLCAAYKEGKLQGRLKEIASMLKEDDNPVMMLVKFK